MSLPAPLRRRNLRGGRTEAQCRLNRGHIGPHSTLDLTVSVDRERLEEILNG